MCPSSVFLPRLGEPIVIKGVDYYNDDGSRFYFFVNTVFLWNTLSFDVFDLSSSKFRQAVYKLFCCI